MSLPSGTIGFPNYQTLRALNSTATTSGVWTNSELVINAEVAPLMFVIQNVGAGSGRISVQVAHQSGGDFTTLLSAANIATSNATYSGIRVETLSEPWPYARIQHRDGVDGSGTNLNAWVIVA